MLPTDYEIQRRIRLVLINCVIVPLTGEPKRVIEISAPKVGSSRNHPCSSLNKVVVAPEAGNSLLGGSQFA